MESFAFVLWWNLARCWRWHDEETNRSLSGDLVLLAGKVPEGCLLSCILKELFSQNKAAQSVIKTTRWRSRPFMCSPLRALPFLLKHSQSSPLPFFAAATLPTWLYKAWKRPVWSCCEIQKCTPWTTCTSAIVRRNIKLAFLVSSDNICMSHVVPHVFFYPLWWACSQRSNRVSPVLMETKTLLKTPYSSSFAIAVNLRDLWSLVEKAVMVLVSTSM